MRSANCGELRWLHVSAPARRPMQQMILTALIFAGNEGQNRPIRPKGADCATAPASHRRPHQPASRPALQLQPVLAVLGLVGLGVAGRPSCWRSPEGLTPDFHLACRPVRCRKIIPGSPRITSHRSYEGRWRLAEDCLE
jgi:hypothetical protein